MASAVRQDRHKLCQHPHVIFIRRRQDDRIELRVERFERDLRVAPAVVAVDGLELVLGALGISDAFRVQREGFLVLSRPGSNQPSVRAGEDLRFQAERAKRGFELLRVAAAAIDSLPEPGSESGLRAIVEAPIAYDETCLSFCDRVAACRKKSTEMGAAAVLGRDMGRFLGTTSLPRAVELLKGDKPGSEAERDLVRRIDDAKGQGRHEMTGHDAVRRLAAFADGKPLPNGETLRVPKPGVSVEKKDILITAFVRMGGESGPWGIAFGQPGRKPEVLSIAEPRTRDYVAEMAADFAPVLRKHLMNPQFDPAGRVEAHGGGRPELPLRQVWLPNQAHLEMLHCLAYTYHRTKLRRRASSRGSSAAGTGLQLVVS